MSTPKHAGLVDIPAMQDAARTATPAPVVQSDEMRDLPFATVAMQKREAERIDRIVGCLDRIKQERTAALATPAPVAQPAPWKHDCADLLQSDVELRGGNCPHCEKPRPTPHATALMPMTDEQIIARTGAVGALQIYAISVWRVCEHVNGITAAEPRSSAL